MAIAADEGLQSLAGEARTACPEPPPARTARQIRGGHRGLQGGVGAIVVVVRISPLLLWLLLLLLLLLIRHCCFLLCYSIIEMLSSLYLCSEIMRRCEDAIIIRS
mgnify:CR=1 FL=1